MGILAKSNIISELNRGLLCERTASRGLTISYHPGILIPKFCRQVLVNWTGGGGLGGCSLEDAAYDCDRDLRRIWEYELHFIEFLSSPPVLC